MIKLNDKLKHPHYLVKKWYNFWFWLRQGLIRDVEIIDGDLRYRFRCGTLREYSRCVKMFVKEPGTCEWIKNELKPGEIFYDIGANIGVYTILAAKTAGPGGKVFAFEPHGANFTRLLDNIVVNNLQDVVTPCNFALNDESNFFPFNYRTSKAGASNSQLASSQAVSFAEQHPEICELKYSASIDSLITSGKFAAPHHIKIDVDGNELLILRGMKDLLSSPQRPQSIQVEIDKRSRVDIPQFMEAHHYVASERHFTRAGLKHIERGGAAEENTFNMIFRLNA
jgi:FkbM family methyltransferase